MITSILMKSFHFRFHHNLSFRVPLYNTTVKDSDSNGQFIHVIPLIIYDANDTG